MAADMSFLSIAVFLSLLFASATCQDVVNFFFDRQSCGSLLPQTRADAVPPPRHDDHNDESVPDDVLVRAAQRGTPNNDHDLGSIMIAARDAPPYTILPPEQGFYRRERLYTVKLEGPEFNGFMLQARRFLSFKTESVVAGTFLRPPKGVKVLDCETDSGPKPNTVANEGLEPRSSVELTWKAPSDNLGNVEFVATVVRNYTYWINVKSKPVLFREFPPSLKGCGTRKSCYRFAGHEKYCAPDQCDFLYMAQVDDEDVVLTFGGKVGADKGYVAVAFAHEQPPRLDIFACVLESPQQVDAVHYSAKNFESDLVEAREALENEETDLVDDHVWCQFRMPLRVKGLDLTQPLSQMLLWGSVRMAAGDPFPSPVLEKSAVLSETRWNHSAFVDESTTVGASSRQGPFAAWTLFVVLATLLQARLKVL